MAKRVAFLFIVGCMTLAATSVGAQSEAPRPRKWWQVEDVQRELDLTPAQVDALEKIFQEKLQERIRLRQELDALEAQWKDAITRGEIDDADAIRLIDKVGEAQIRRNTARTLVLLQMYRVLTPEQRVKLRESQRLARPR